MATYEKRVARDLKVLRSDNSVVKGFTFVDDKRHLIGAIHGPSDTDYSGGSYVFKIELPATYPFAPPVVRSLTPSGRFEVNKSLCISGLTVFHEQTWSASNNLLSILVGVSSMMCEETPDAVGSVASSSASRRQYASRSDDYNERHGLYNDFAWNEHAPPPDVESDAASPSGTRRAELAVAAQPDDNRPAKRSRVTADADA